MPIYINKKRVYDSKFPGGEVCVKIPEFDTAFYCGDFLAYLYSSDDIMCLLMAVDAFKRLYPDQVTMLYLPYFPYSRQDRVCNARESLSVEVMANLINSCNFNHVVIYDPHSEVLAPLLNNCMVRSLSQIITWATMASPWDEDVEKWDPFYDNPVLLAPDKGAAAKVRELGEQMSCKVIYGNKVRNPADGVISETSINGKFEGRNVLIVDDLCDGGATFIELARILKIGGAKRIDLYVTHGIFSKGLEPLKEHFTNVYCITSRIKDPSGEFLIEKGFDV